jgi:hypothetical protein
MISRALSVTFVSALLVGAYAGCSDGGTGTSTSTEEGYHPGGGNPVTGGSSGGGSGGTASSSSGSSSGGSGSSGGTASSSSGSGSSSGSSSGGTPVEAGPPPITLEEAFTQFQSCMSYSDFTSTTANGIAAADIAKAETTQYGNCNACHNAGDGGFWASYGTVQGQNMTQTMFQMSGQFPYVTKWVTGTVDASGQFKDLAPSNDIATQAMLAGQCAAGTPCHPKFQLNPALVQAISDFVTATITRWHNGTCTPSTLPTDAGAGG